MIVKTLITISIFSILNPFSFLLKTPAVEDRTIKPAKLPISEEIAENQSFIDIKEVSLMASFAISASNISNPNFLPIRNWDVEEPYIQATTALVAIVDPDNPFVAKENKILLKHNIDQVLPIASITKLMTSLIVLENLELDEIVSVSKEALEDGFGNKGGLIINEKITVENLLNALLIESSNDAAMVLAKHTEEKTGKNFVDLMNKKAQEIGLSKTYFTEPSGCHSEDVSTAKEIVELVKYSLEYPLIWQIAKTTELEALSIDGEVVHHWKNTNELLGDMNNIIGGKTGYTAEAQGCMLLITEKKIDNQSKYLISLVLGAKERFSEIKKLINWINQAYKWQ